MLPTLKGDPVITCSRCGKENQDHYKFCLGCGNEIKPAPKPATREPAPLETARTILPPEAKPVSGSLGNEPTPLPTLSPPAAGKAKGGIPWNDSPKMPITPSNGGGVASGMLGAVTPPPLTPGSTDPGNWAAPRPMPTTPQAQPASAPTPSPAVVASAPAAVEGTVCPNCGRMVSPGFAFCGACGTRMNVAAAAPSPRTMYMSGPTAAPVPRGRIVLIRPDGSEGGAHPLHDGENLVGRSQGSLFEGDLYLSPRHAEFQLGPQGLVVKDLRSLNGVFAKISGEEPLESGDVIRIGQELLRFEIIAPPTALEDGTEVAGTPNPGFWGRLSVVVGRDVDGSAFPLFGDAIVMGRERGDILFPEDGYVSGTHARISLRDGRVYLADVGSSNGTFLRVRGERTLPSGSFILMGQQLFRAEYK